MYVLSMFFLSAKTTKRNENQIGTEQQNALRLRTIFWFHLHLAKVVSVPD